MNNPPSPASPAADTAKVRTTRTILTELPRRAKRLIMIGCDVLLLTAAFLTTLSVRFADTPFAITEIILMLAISPLIAVPVFGKFGLYRAVIRYLELRVALTVLASVTVASVLLYVSVKLIGLHQFTVGDALAYWTTTLLYVGTSRILAREYFRQQSSRDTQAVVIYGAGGAGVQLAMSLRDHPRLKLVAFVDDDPDLAGSVLYGVRVHPAERLLDLAVDHGVREVLLALPSASRQQKREIFARIEPLRLRMRAVPDLTSLVEGRAKISDVHDVGIDELLGRDIVPPVPRLLSRCIFGKSVLVTGAGGSIGSELCRQILANGPARLVLFEQSEFALYSISDELAGLKHVHGYTAEIVSVLGSVTDQKSVRATLAKHHVHTVYHAAAYKHVPLVEANPHQGIRNNIVGTWRTAQAALSAHVENFVLVSTDKAVRPTNVMGATKRVAELIMQAIGSGSRTRFCMVRFGNVLDSSGSVVPLFRKQIEAGGPVSVTHADITRYFMTIPEAAQLVLQAGSMARGGDVFVLDMGEPVRIRDLARTMIHLSGLTVRDESNPDGDIQIRYIGLRPGEKLHEELLIGDTATGTDHPRIMRAMEEALDWAELEPLLVTIERACEDLDTERALAVLAKLVPLKRAGDGAEHMSNASTLALPERPRKAVTG
jgi:FlaA1/EpsC-like NDP-sugar epimerase